MPGDHTGDTPVPLGIPVLSFFWYKVETGVEIDDALLEYRDSLLQTVGWVD